jgi:uncharacterized protein with GYD domain
VVCEVDDTADAIAMWLTMGFKERTRTVSLIRN